MIPRYTSEGACTPDIIIDPYDSRVLYQILGSILVQAESKRNTLYVFRYFARRMIVVADVSRVVVI